MVCDWLPVAMIPAAAHDPKAAEDKLKREKHWVLEGLDDYRP